MSRALRIEFEGALYHVMNHGTGNLWLYKDQRIMVKCIKLLSILKNKYEFEIYSFILMKNHYHILIGTPHGNLSKGMLYFNRELAKFFNWIYNRKGKVFRNRYRAILIDKQQYLANVYKYLNQNALRKDIVERVEDYKGGMWYYLCKESHVTKNIINEIIDWDEILDLFNFQNIPKILDWLNEELEKDDFITRYDSLLGDSTWVNSILKEHLNKDEVRFPIKCSMKIQKREPDIWRKFKKLKNYRAHPQYKNIVIYLLDKYSDLTQREIADKLGIKNGNAVSQRLFKFRRRALSQISIADILGIIENNLTSKK